MPNTGQTAEKCGEQRSKVQKIHIVALGLAESGGIDWKRPLTSLAQENELENAQSK
jgi:hypothetical protein